jgi:hypothetical protein
MRVAAGPGPRLLALLLALGWLGAVECATAAEPRFEPARFVDGPDSMQGLVQIPSPGRDGIVSVRCEGVLSETGHIRGSSYCQAVGAGLYAYELAAVAVTLKLRVQPARVNGVGRRVWFQYRFEFEQLGEARRVRVYANHGQQIETFGGDYIGPQRIIEGAQDRTVFRTCITRLRFIVQASVTETGQAEAVSVTDYREGSAACRRVALEAVRSSDFLPAVTDGAVVRALYFEPFLGPSSIRGR